MEQQIYLDNAATTPLLPEAFEAMRPFFCDMFANASSLHSFGAHVRFSVENARQILASILGADAEEIYFTSGGTEADNWAIKGICRANKNPQKNRILCSSIEHHAVLDTMQSMKQYGYKVEMLPVSKEGIVLIDECRNLLDEHVLLVSIMHANNETGMIQPAEQVGKLCRDRGILFHVDAVQSFGKIPVDIQTIQADLLSISGHKFGGPKGVGALYIKEETEVEPFMDGGGQERKKRAGTINAPGAVGMGAAAQIAVSRMDHFTETTRALTHQLIDRIASEIPGATLCGTIQNRLPHIAQICFEGVEGVILLQELDHHGICVSSGAACSSGSTEPSHVLLSMGISPIKARGAIRFSFGWRNLPEHVEITINQLKESYFALHGMRK
jgi:cysteine desulfurase